MTSTLISSLQQISRLESSIAGIPDSLRRLDSDIQSKAQEFKNLNQVHQMPIAYVNIIFAFLILMFSNIIDLKSF